MSRFLSKHEIKKNEWILNDDLLNASKYKEELRDAIDIENHRINIDSAKKRAVMQGMNYDGFHQMVLGADLKGVKTSELLAFQPKGVILNTVMTQNLYLKEDDFLAGNFVKTEQKGQKCANLANIQCNDVLSTKEYYKNFKRCWRSCKEIDEKIKLLSKIEIDNLTTFKDIINCDILEADFFLELIFNIGTFTLVSHSDCDQKTLQFLLSCLNAIATHEKFPSLKKFIGKKHKAIYLEIDLNKLNIFTEVENINILVTFISLFI